MPRRTTDKVIASDVQYIDPLGCDSTIAYKIVKRGNTTKAWSNVTLSDCERHISWYFYSNTPLTKIDKAIDMLNDFRAALVTSRAKTKRVVRKKRATKA